MSHFSKNKQEKNQKYLFSSKKQKLSYELQNICSKKISSSKKRKKDIVSIVLAWQCLVFSFTKPEMPFQ